MDRVGGSQFTALSQNNCYRATALLYRSCGFAARGRKCPCLVSEANGN